MNPLLRRRQRTTDKRRRILVLNHYALPLTQGGGTRHIELFSRLDSSRWSFTIFASNRVPQSREPFATDNPHFRLIPIPAYDDRNGRQRIIGWLVYAVRALLLGLRSPRPDVVYASTPHLLTPVAGLVIAWLRRSRFVLEIRDLWPESLVQFGYLARGGVLHRALGWLERHLYRAADHIVIVTPGWRDYLTEQGVVAHSITTVSNGSDPDVFAPRPSAQSLRTLLGVEGPVVIYAGAHGPPNGLENVLDAAADLPEVTFALFGSGASKAALVHRAKDERLTNVIFRDPVPKSELAKYLWTADIGLHTMADMALFREGMSPNKLYDYMAAKLPIVSNAGSAARQLIEAAGCGAAANPDGLAEAIREMLALNEDERNQMGERGHDWMLMNASRQAVVAHLERSLLASSKR